MASHLSMPSMPGAERLSFERLLLLNAGILSLLPAKYYLPKVIDGLLLFQAGNHTRWWVRGKGTSAVIGPLLLSTSSTPPSTPLPHSVTLSFLL